MTANQYQSTVERESVLWPGVRYQIEKMSFGRRIELMKTVREATARIEFLNAAGQTDRMSAAILATEVDRIYLQWGLKHVEGLTIDGMAATPELLVVAGPEGLSQEALAYVRFECGLSDEEKKT